MTRRAYFVDGRVQGVGFRPYIYKVATQLSLCGFVKNTMQGVVMEIEGDEKKLAEFEQMLQKQHLPSLAEIENITKKDLKPLYSEQFEIIQSTTISSAKKAIVLPDMAICNDCISEINSFTSNRFYNYFATTCTNCGPRYSIVQTVPYDRENTSMAKFKMCRECEREYTDPTDRRYHAQPISCPNCGPKLTTEIKTTAQKIQQGDIVTIKGIGGFHIVCDATNDKSVKKLREYKNRPTKPFALMCKNLEELQTIAEISKEEKTALMSKEAPIVILKKNRKRTSPNLLHQT